ncbi:hypothetical protein D0Z07_8778 [Hyphodiscus hymeniophilus]|uniref:Uncharacterized protein n=1 Tax=Hyphodiscus hymeniophilus TaxID=353542 RepID=A0A9P6SMW9_9HELO|nr:hypothetical protein D0Z07_8778 [Hyphodiscus hymeniophilus]
MGQTLLLLRNFARSSIPVARLGAGSRFIRFRSPNWAIQGRERHNSTISSTKPPAGAHSRKPVLPERLLVFHAGTGRSVFLGCWKISTIFIFSFFCLVLAPSYFQSDDQPIWGAVGVVAIGVVPMTAVAYLTSPFVANIHLRLPPFARYSRELVHRYSQALPKDAKLELTTMNFIGMPRVTRITISELRPARERFGLVNYVRDTKEKNSKRSWYMGKASRQFAVHGGTRITQGSGVWENVAATISKRSN